MYVTYHCPKCDHLNRSADLAESESLTCTRCDWSREFTAGSGFRDPAPKECLRCGNADLWRQKNFPQSLGLLFVTAGALISSVAWAYHRPILALGILMAFALVDMVLYLTMPDVLVCYRCRTKHHAADVSGHAAFDHELGERYRQERIRLEQADQQTSV